MYKVKLYYFIHSIAPTLEETTQSTTGQLTWQKRDGVGMYRIVRAPWANAIKETRLPFPPYPGLRLDIDGVDSFYPIIRVVWHNADRDIGAPYFSCHFEDLYPKDNLTYEKRKQYAVGSGWKVVEFGGADQASDIDDDASFSNNGKNGEEKSADENSETERRIAELEEELYIGLYPIVTEEHPDRPKWLRYLERVKREKDADSDMWKRMCRFDE
jgi:hypothetical protein